jgi:hypothetical protein
MSHRTPYRDLIAAAASLVDAALLDDSSATVPVLRFRGDASLVDLEYLPNEAAREYLSKNRNALSAARIALQNECAVPVRYDQQFYTEHTEDFGHLRSLAKTFALELSHAKLNSDFAAAVRIGVDLLELANAVRRGGLLMDFLVSLSISSMAIEELRGGPSHRSDRAESTRRELRNELARIERSRESLQVIVDRDRKWEAAVGWQDESVDFANIPLSEMETGIPEEHQRAVFDALQSMANLPSDELTLRYRELDNRDLAMQRLLFVDLALRSYQAIHQSYPDNLTSLVPTICSDLPGDPFTDDLFRYQRLAMDKFVLYSPGPTQVDHGGQFGHWLAVTAGEADLCLDVGDYWWDEWSI